MPENLDQVTALAAEHIEITRMRIAAELLLDLQCQAVHASPHVGLTDRQPHPHAGRDRDHRRASALTIAAANSAGTELGIRTRTLPANSTSIAGSPHTAPPTAASAAVSGGAISTDANPSATALNSFRQR